MILDDVAEQLSPFVTECTRYTDYYFGSFGGKPVFKISPSPYSKSKVLIHVLCWDDKDRFHKETFVLTKAIELITKSIKWLKDYNLQVKMEAINEDFQ